ncbi:erythromycin esterase family protein [Actinoalloteichus hymeniacidonis]|uniref:Erythromycin esterase-like enzyme n=1 Tax=Actinoalloteichus hymeniacidonis TaxID=340345 RepID=A0AAC9HSS7_9PSEU|nr:erythromycin esterase family protein [Actinoalloteichus hymeniacidonis]AOS64972.1 erythromycin esterase-like enzyme [Actinoalloteichus hymeniacidonis]MBB5906953.1 hypothetical protein [Actinoalloteichus hymeniacidonis]
MSQDIRDFVTPETGLLALGEPTHLEPAFPLVRNEIFARLVEFGFRSIAIESDRVAALAVNDFVLHGTGTLDAAMAEGFSHNFGHIDANRQLVAWLRDYNKDRPEAERLAFHGFDAPMETMSVPSPRRYLEYVRDYLDLDLDIASLTGADELWSRQEAVLDAASSPGATTEAEKLRTIADDMLVALLGRAPQLIATTSRPEWFRAKNYLTAGLGLLRYHRQAARTGDPSTRWSGLSGTRDASMAQNLLDIREIEQRRGPTLVFAHNLHLQKAASYMRMGPMEVHWSGAGAIASSLLGEQYTFVAGSVGRSAAIDLGEPAPETHEGELQRRFATWGLTAAAELTSTRSRTDTTVEQGYFPLDEANLTGADSVWHINTGTELMPESSGLRLRAREVSS